MPSSQEKKKSTRERSNHSTFFYTSLYQAESPKSLSSTSLPLHTGPQQRQEDLVEDSDLCVEAAEAPPGRSSRHGSGLVAAWHSQLEGESI